MAEWHLDWSRLGDWHCAQMSLVPVTIVARHYRILRKIAVRAARATRVVGNAVGIPRLSTQG